MSKIVLEESGEAYYEKMEQSGCKMYFERHDWKELLKESEKQPFDLKNGELVRTYIIHAKEETFTWEAYDSTHKTYWKNHSSEIVIQTYNADELKSVCPDGVTLNSYLLAKLLKKFPESKVIGIPVSIREGNDAMSNQTSGIAITYDYNFKVSLEENAAQIQKKLLKQIKSKKIKYFVLSLMAHLEPTLIDSVLLCSHNCYKNALSEKMANIMGYTGTKGRD